MTVNTTKGGSAYESPICSVMDISSEGILCQSGGNLSDGFHEGVDGDDTPII